MKAPTKSIDTFILFFNLADWRWARYKPPGANPGLPPPSEPLPSWKETQKWQVSLFVLHTISWNPSTRQPQTCVSNGIKTNLKVTPRSAKSSVKWKLLKRSRERQVAKCRLENAVGNCVPARDWLWGEKSWEAHPRLAGETTDCFRASCLRAGCLFHHQKHGTKGAALTRVLPLSASRTSAEKPSRSQT